MTVRIIVLLSLAVCFHASMIGMGLARGIGVSRGTGITRGADLVRKGKELAFKSLARLITEPRRNFSESVLGTSNVSNQGAGNVMVTYEGALNGSYGVRFVTNRLPEHIITAFYMCGTKNQFGFLTNYPVFSCSDYHKKIEEGIEEGVDTCRDRGGSLTRVMAIYMVPDEWFTRKKIEHSGRELFDSLVAQKKLKKAVHDFWHFCSKSLETAVEYNVNVVQKPVILDTERGMRQFGLFLDPNSEKSYYYEEEPGYIFTLLNPPVMPADTKKVLGG